MTVEDFQIAALNRNIKPHRMTEEELTRMVEVHQRIAEYFRARGDNLIADVMCEELDRFDEELHRRSLEKEPS